MGPKTLIVLSSSIFFLAVLWQLFLRDTLFVTFGLLRTHQKISDFPFQCRRLESPLLESCEDMVLDEEGRTLSAACSTVEGQRDWVPGGSKYNISARTFNDHISVINIDNPGADGLCGLHALSITGSYVSASGGKELDVHGIALEVLSPERLRFWLVNHRPPVDTQGNFQDAKKVGANSTIEVFEHVRGSKSMEHVKTIFDPEVVFTPNNLMATGNGGVYITNDHNSKVGRFRSLEMLFGGGSVAFCHLNGTCHLAAPSSTHSFKFANGITGSPSRRPMIYVANSANGLITAHVTSSSDNTTFSSGPGLAIPLGMPVDNLSVDSKGDIYAACFPDVLALVDGMDGPVRPMEQRKEIPSTVFRIRRVLSEGMFGTPSFEVVKVLEDIEGKFLPGATTAVHDVRTGNIWLGGVASPFITVCERVA